MKRSAENTVGSSPKRYKNTRHLTEDASAKESVIPLQSPNQQSKKKPRNKSKPHGSSNDVSTERSQQARNHQPRHVPTHATNPLSSASTTSHPLDIVTAEQTNAHLNTSQILTKKQEKRLRKAQKKAAAEAISHIDPSIFPSVPSTTNQPSSPPNSTTLVESSSRASTSEPRDSALDLPPGCFITPKNFYTSLSTLTPNTGGINVIGVVTHLGEVKKTTTGELCRSVKIVDPSNFDAEADFGLITGFNVICFTAKHPGWLPSPKMHDVLILRSVKVSEFNGSINAVVYKEKLQWAIFDPDNGVHHGDKGDSPDSDLGDGFSYPLTPFYDVRQHAELTYCRRLVDWWQASLTIMQKKLGFIHQIGANDFSSLSNLPRCHRLISEASPYLKPDGFMDCTIEVLKIEKNQYGIVNVFVTDYTLNPHIGDFFSAELADRVLRLEMNDAAADLEQDMKAGDYWFLKNTRVKIGFEKGLLEGRLRENRGVRKLDPKDLLNEPHFEALLRNMRKEEWKMANRSSDGGLKHLLITDTTKDILFNCTVEVIYAELNPSSLSYLYITDYTPLPGPPTPTSTGGRLDTCTLKVALSHGQVEMAGVVDRGYYTICKLRLQELSEGDRFRGRLGGNDRLVHKLNPTESNSQHLKALIQRKEDWLVQ